MRRREQGSWARGGKRKKETFEKMYFGED